MDLRIIDAETTRPLRQQILRPHQAVSELVYPDDDAPETLHVGMWDGDRLVSTASLYREPMPDQDPTQPAWRLRGMATLPEYRRQGLGKLLVEYFYEYVQQQGGGTIWCNARTTAEPFYRSLDFQQHGPVFDLPDIGPHVIMWRNVQAGL